VPAPRSCVIVGWLCDLAGPVRVAYQAGPTGFGLARACEAAGSACVVAAPSLIARSPAGRARKSDASDAEQLARLLRPGELTAVRVPDPADEAARDWLAREDARADLMRTRHRLSKLLLRHGLVYESGRAWTAAPEAWLRRQRLAHPSTRAAFEDYHAAVLGAGLRRERLDEQIARMALDPRFAPVVGRLSCLRGVGTLAAFALAVEIGDFHRLRGATIGAYLGLTPSESQSGSRHRRSPITKAGNSHARRLLVEAAWHHRPALRASAVSSAAAPDNALRCASVPSGAGVRPHHRWHQLTSSVGLPHPHPSISFIRREPLTAAGPAPRL